MAEPLLEGLRRNGFETDHVVYAAQVLPAVMSSAGVDVVLLDLGLPDGDGLEVLRDLSPVIAATAERAAHASLADLGAITIKADIAAMRHETQHSRVFRT